MRETYTPNNKFEIYGQSTASQEGMPEPKPARTYVSQDVLDIERAVGEGMVPDRVIIPAATQELILRTRGH